MFRHLSALWTARHFLLALVKLDLRLRYRRSVLGLGWSLLHPLAMTALTAGLALVPLVLAKGEPGKEILCPVATVILGGLVSSTILDMAVTPAVFYRFGGRALARLVAPETGLSSSSPAALPPELDAAPSHEAAIHS